MDKDQLKRKVEKKAWKEYAAFKREILRKPKREIWDGCQKIYFYGCVMEYFHYGKESSHSWEVLQNVKQPILAMWDCYQQNEHLEYATWRDIEMMLNELEKQEERNSQRWKNCG